MDYISTMVRKIAIYPLILFILFVAMAGEVFSATVDVYLSAETFTKAMPDGQMITMWGFVETDSSFVPLPGQQPSVPGPTLTALAGDTLNIHLINNITGPLIEPISILIPGQVTIMTPVWDDGSTGDRANLNQRVRSFTQEAATGGGTATYTWTNIKAGTYIYQSGTHPAVQIQMGLYGALIVNAAASQAYTPTPTIPDTSYVQDIQLFFSEIDPDVHDAIASGTYGTPPDPTSTIHYHPKYFLINGEPFSYARSAVQIANHSERTLLRFLNAGLQDHVPVLQGIYMEILAEDGNLFPFPKKQYSLHLPAGKTMDAIIVPNVEGYIPVYDRRLYLTNSAISPGGMLVYLKVASAAQYTLTINKTGTGTGIVEATSFPGGINCGLDCNETYNEGTLVKLTATPDAGSVFNGWSGGGCSGTGTCIVTMNSDTIVTAAFNDQGSIYSISGTVTTPGTGRRPGSPIAGVTMSLTGAATGTTTTNAIGNYTFTGLANGSYTVTPSLAGYTFTPTSRAVTVSGANVTGQDFTGTATVTYSISGTVSTSGGSPIAGVTMSLTGAATGTTTTDASGNYTFTGLANGSYTVTPSLAGYTFTPTSRTIIISGANSTGQDFTGTATVTYSISGTVSTSGGSPIAGVTMSLTGAATGTTTTDASGNYTFTGLANGSYTVTPSLAGYTFTPTSRNVTVSGANVTGQDFTGTAGPAPTYSISGTVRSATGTPMSFVTIILTGAATGTTTTNASGIYSFTGLANGSYTVTPSLRGCVFTPTSRAVTVSGANVTGQDFICGITRTR